MGDLTAHFSRAEFSDRRARREVEVPVRLVGMLENLRGQVGRPLRIVSGYRTPETNRLVGGAPESRHLHADAADIPSGYATLAQARAAGATGVGLKGGWAVHVDVRPGPLVVWTYP